MAQRSQPDSVILRGDLVLQDAEDLVPRLCAALDAAGPGRPAVVDGAGAKSCHVAVLQLLLSARVSAARRGVPLEVRAPAGGALEAAMTRAGLSPADLGVVRGGEAGA